MKSKDIFCFEVFKLPTVSFWCPAPPGSARPSPREGALHPPRVRRSPLWGRHALIQTFFKKQLRIGIIVEPLNLSPRLCAPSGASLVREKPKGLIIGWTIFAVNFLFGDHEETRDISDGGHDRGLAWWIV